MRARFLAAGFVAFLLSSRSVLAVPEGLEFAWSAPEGCPSEAEVLAAVEQLVGGPDAALERPLRADARVERNGAGFRLALGWNTATASAVRTVDGATCAEIAQAAAVIVALAADPATNLEELAQAQPGEAPAPPPLAPMPPKPQPEPVQATTKADPARPAPRAADDRPGVRAGTALDLGSLPRAAPGVFLGGELPVLPLRVVLEAATFVPVDEVVADGAGSFWLTALSLRPCFRLPVSELVLAPCAAAELHLMLGKGDLVEIPDERWAAYLRLGAGLEASYRIAPGLEVFIGALALVAPSRPTFVIADAAPIHEPNTVAGRIALGFELHL